MDYLILQKNSIEDLELDRKSYLWIIWYFWKVRNVKLFRGIDMDLLELIKHAEGKWQAWFAANALAIIEAQSPKTIVPQIVCLQNVCVVYCSWTSTSLYSSGEWVCKDVWKNLIYGYKEPNKTSLLSTFRAKTLGWAIENMLSEFWNGPQRFDINDWET